MHGLCCKPGPQRRLAGRQPVLERVASGLQSGRSPVAPLILARPASYSDRCHGGQRATHEIRHLRWCHRHWSEHGVFRSRHCPNSKLLCRCRCVCNRNTHAAPTDGGSGNVGVDTRGIPSADASAISLSSLAPHSPTSHPRMVCRDTPMRAPSSARVSWRNSRQPLIRSPWVMSLQGKRVFTPSSRTSCLDRVIPGNLCRNRKKYAKSAFLIS